MLLSTWLPEDWSAIFVPSTPILEIVVRGSVIYLVLFFGLRFLLKREAAGIRLTDLLVVVLIADAVQNGMAGEYTDVPDALVLAATIIGWSMLLSFVSYRFPRIRRVIEPQPLLLIKDGKLLQKNAASELLTRDEIMGQLREQGVERIEDVKEAYMESNGVITVIPREKQGKRKHQPNKAAP
ncbi:DUF421 domain-containing protein [Sphaerobacter sp.]|uniref:DUF421 domain-containing protein n=1 Tax=Sphaerobacter sp. TaxID=2099654 RepID=UPI001D5862E3|nr:YetF domain-containing protein [Sphaerobacter sp.]MBX5445523.1 DUF421 domain-containing protein [Sphaerobacter sp.]